MDIMFSPWRSQYVQSASQAKNADTLCFLCEAAVGDDISTYVVHRSDLCFVILNRYPYNSGHCMVVPYEHTGDITELSNEVMNDIGRTQQQTIRVLREMYAPHGFNCGMNLGAIAGAGVPGHIHLHIVPRWNGDLNFMPVIADVKVAIESLDDSYRKVRDAFQRIH